MRRIRLPSVHVRGIIGRVRVTRLPTRIPKKVFGKPITKQAYLEAWALSHQPDMTDKAKFKQFLKERVTMPKAGKLSPAAQYKQDVRFHLGYDANPSDLSRFRDLGLDAYQAANAIRRVHAVMEVKDAKKR